MLIILQRLKAEECEFISSFFKERLYCALIILMNTIVIILWLSSDRDDLKYINAELTTVLIINIVYVIISAYKERQDILARAILQLQAGHRS